MTLTPERVGFALAITLAMAFSCAGVTRVAAAVGPNGDTDVLADRPTASISIYQTNRAITSAMDVDVVVTNLTQRSVDITSVEVILPPALVALRPRLNEKLVDQSYELSPGSQRIHPLRIGSVSLSLYEVLFNVHTLLFIPGEYTMRVQVEFKNSNPNAVRQMGYATQAVPLAAPLSSLLRGGVLGALLLAIFVPAYRRLKEQSRGFAALSTQFVVFLVSGSVVAVTAILLLQRLGGLNLPITIEVKDYLGGIVVGLFSYKIGDVLYAQFFETSAETGGS